jgi:outer membrane receptor protein involved in Fe transport
MNKYTIKVLSALFVVFFSFTAVHAQSTTGSINGTVEGASAGTVVVAVDTSRNVERSVSAANGTFSIGDLVPGNYTVEVRNGNNVVDSVDVQVRVDIDLSLSLATSNNVIEEILVSGERIDALDIGIAESGIVVTSEEIEALPVGRSLNSVAMLSPGATRGDASFGGVSFSGSSVAENQTYINGLPVTNFRTGVGFGYAPFEFFGQMQTRTGGYGPEYGRSTGGVINAVTKSGSNDFRFGVNSNSSYNQSTSPNTYWSNNAKDDYGTDVTDYWVSGPIWRDRVFYYAMQQDYSYESEYWDNPDTGSGWGRTEQDQTFKGFKIDAYITDNQRLEYTFWDSTSSIFGKTWSGGANWDGESEGDYLGEVESFTGGENWIASYTGDFGPFTLRYAVGENNENRTTPPVNADQTPSFIYGNGTARAYTNWVTSAGSLGSDKREVSRFDIEFDLLGHNIRVGTEEEVLTAIESFEYNTGYFWRVFADNGPLPQARDNFWCVNLEASYGAQYNFECSDDYAGSAVRYEYRSGGTFENTNSAFYISDTFNIGALTLELGLRNDHFKNLNAERVPFIEVKDQWAPRLSAAYQIDSRTNLFANYGNYYLPIAANTNIRMSGAEVYNANYFQINLPNGYETTPTSQGEQLVPSSQRRFLFEQVYSDGSVPNPRDILDQNTDPMFQVEYVLGVERILDNGMVLGVKGLYRTLDTTIEDILIEDGVMAYYAGTEYEDAVSSVYGYYPGSHYILTNPGQDATIYIPVTGETVTLTADQLGVPAPTREWTALEVTLQRAWDGRGSDYLSYTWGSSYGNYEGWVRSDNGQDDAGITSLFDSGDMTNNGEGPLPNDRTHTLKYYGNRMLSDNFLVGLNVMYQSGRPLNCFGQAPGARTYTNSMFYCDGNVVERGERGRLDGILSIDLNAQYTLRFANQEVILTGTVYNLLDSSKVAERYEQDTSTYYEVTSYQSPRTVRMGFRYNFN